MNDQHDDDLDLTQNDGTMPPLPDFVEGNYIVTCIDMADAGKSRWPRTDPVTKKPILNDAGEQVFPEQWKWVFRFDEVNEVRPSKAQRNLIGKEVHQWTNKGLGEKAHTTLYINALIGRKVDKQERPKRSWVIGNQARANLTFKENGGPKITLTAMPQYDDDEYVDEQPPTDLPAANPVEQMAQQAQGDSRDQIMEDLLNVEDRRDLAPILTRMDNLGLGDDEEVNNVYDLTFSRLAGGSRQLQRNTQQPALTQ